MGAADGPFDALAVHTVVRGRGWLWLDAQTARLSSSREPSRWCAAGRNYIGHEPGAACQEPDEFPTGYAAADPVENPQATVFLCGAYRFSGDIGRALLDALPPVMTLAAAIDDPLRDVVTLLSAS